MQADFETLEPGETALHTPSFNRKGSNQGGEISQSAGVQHAAASLLTAARSRAVRRWGLRFTLTNQALGGDGRGVRKREASRGWRQAN